ncbi:MAG: EamA family transporter [Lachnospiraceae bacterium]|nr:EamA family transporter [Lachnospiraceae bacterium]
MRKVNFGPMYVAAAGILWGVIGIPVRGLSALGFSSMQIVESRSLLAVILLSVLFFIRDRSLFKIRLKDIWMFLGTGIASQLFFNWCYFQSIRIMSLSAAAVLLYTAPSFVMVLSALIFHEKITGKAVISILLTFLGCMFVTGFIHGGSLPLMGILIGLGAGFGYSLYSIFGRFAINAGYRTATIVFYTVLFCFLGSLCMPGQASAFHQMTSSPSAIGYIVLISIFNTLLPHFAYMTGLSLVENSRASVIASIEPVVASLLGILAFHESCSWENVLGIVLVLTGILICNLKKSPAAAAAGTNAN